MVNLPASVVLASRLDSTCQKRTRRPVACCGLAGHQVDHPAGFWL